MKVVIKVPRKKRIPLEITTEFIRLDAALKLCGAVGTGGQAKEVVQDSLVKVNSQVCTQRGKKLRPHDEFEFNSVIYEVTQCS